MAEEIQKRWHLDDEQTETLAVNLRLKAIWDANQIKASGAPSFYTRLAEKLVEKLNRDDCAIHDFSKTGGIFELAEEVDKEYLARILKEILQ